MIYRTLVLDSSGYWLILNKSHHNKQLTRFYSSTVHIFNVNVGPSYIYIYIYIYCHPQTETFALSEPFSVARPVGRTKLGSKPIQLYVRLNFKPLGQQAYHVWLRELLRYLCSNSSSRLLTFLYPIGYQSAQFFRRTLHYASGGRSIYIYIY